MSESFEEYLCKYIDSRAGVFKKYILAAINNKDGCIWYLESSEGMIVPSSDLKNCEILRDALIFSEDTKISRTGRNTYKVFCLTELGKRFAEEVKQAAIVEQPIETEHK